MGWKDGRFEPADWDSYNEGPLLLLLGIGLDQLPASSWWAIRRSCIATEHFGRIHAGDESFMHQFLPLYIGHRQVQDGLFDIWENSTQATRYNKWFTDGTEQYPGGLWGLSATLMPVDGYFAYAPRDASPGRDASHDGTVSLSAAVASSISTPRSCKPASRRS